MSVRRYFGRLVNSNAAVKHWPTAMLLAVTLSGCSVFGTAPPEEQVRRLSEEWLEALLQGDYKKAYSYTTPGYQATHSARDHGRSYAGVAMWRKAEIGDVTCEGNQPSRCTAMLMVTYKSLRGGFENTRPLELIWIRTENSNWGLYKD